MQIKRDNGAIGIQVDGRGFLPIPLILGIGRNYADHAKEQGFEPPVRPLVFHKSPASLILDTETIVIPECCADPEQVDFEAELGVILKQSVKDIHERDALDAVLGYCCANDVSARWWQREGAGGQFSRGKSFDTFCPIGPALTPAADIPDPQALRMSCDVSGERMQEDSTASMMWSVAQLIAELSRGATLPEGTLILTGTPSGVGAARKPPRFLRDGDSVTVSIDRVGAITNPVRAQGA